MDAGKVTQSVFLSTRSARRATATATGGYCSSQVISIHALREEGDYELRRENRQYKRFLSTPSARRATCPLFDALAIFVKFLSTPSARRATLLCEISARLRSISIHALREEGDFFWTTCPTSSQYFYPRPPRGGRLVSLGD